ncbi:MAG: N-acetylglucosamine-6-phosphate deacetylase [Myxococcales bacterium]|nr:N-acetylglucosamine-6-phosphate deacetylase [Myxococcales bacterium]
MTAPLPCDLRLEARLLLDRGIVSPGVLLVRDGSVLWSGAASEAPPASAATTLQLGELTVAPGYVDVHVHGARGADVVDGSAEALQVIARAHCERGTTAWCPTILTASVARTLRALEAIADACEAEQRAGDDAHEGARVIGAHLEGPFLNPARAGAQPVEHMRAPDGALLDELLAAARGHVSVMTIAPELPGALGLVRTLAARGVAVSVGHSDATFEQVAAAVDAGARSVTHLFNAMRPLHHREPGVVGAALAFDSLTAEVIADGVHVAAPTLRLVPRLLSVERVALITDCTAALDAEPGAARLGDRPVQVRDGSARFEDGTLAGSVLSMDRAVQNMVQLAGVHLRSAVACASRVPSRLVGASQLGSLSQGRNADFVVLDDELAVTATFIAGKLASGELEALEP